MSLHYSMAALEAAIQHCRFDISEAALDGRVTPGHDVEGMKHGAGRCRG